MFRNYLLIAWRNFRKHKGFTAINIIGLSLSMSVCLVIISLIHDHYQYDKFHPEGDNTFRITSSYKGRTGIFGDSYATSPLPFGEKLKSEYAAVENYCNLSHMMREGEVRSPHKIFDARGLFADNQFFNVFGFKLKEGNPATALNNPFSMVITEEMASKLFPDGDAMGSIVEFEDHGSYRITGIVETIEDNSHIQFDVLGSFNTIDQLVEKNVLSNNRSWENIWANYNYLVLSDEKQKDQIIQAINSIGNENIEIEDEDHPGYEFSLQKITEIIPGKLMSNEIAFALPGIVLLFFGLLGVIVIVTASINYTNLSIAKSISRAREIGIRKANGARRSHILWQFLVESIFIAILSLGGAILIYKFLIVKFNELWIFNIIGLKIEDDWVAYVYFFIFSLFLGLFTGILPSLFLSGLDTIRSLKGDVSRSKIKKGISRYFSGKKILTGIQFGFASLLLVSIFLIKDQGDFLVHSNYGFDEEEVFFIELQSHDPELISSEFTQVPGVENVTFTSHHPAVGRSQGESVKLNPEDEDVTIYHFSVDKNYPDVMGLKLIAGEGFPLDSDSDLEKYTVLNQKAVELLRLGSPEEALGKVLILGDSLRLTVTGVVSDYHWEPIMKSIRPLMLRIIPEQYEYAYFRTSFRNPADQRNRFKEKWESYDEGREFKGGFLNEELDEFYQFFYDLGGILTLVGILAIVITSLGFMGMVGFDLKTRTKEIGIRKVLGATFSSLALTLSRSFLIMLVISALIAVPLAILINGLWIYEMANYSPIGFSNVGPAILIVIILSGVTILTQLIKHINQNPANTLRTE